MKKREITPGELKKIIDLRHLGSNWTKIEVETNVERRAARRAFEEWEHDNEIRERNAVRFRVAAEAWHEHMNDLVNLASCLVSKLSLSPAMADLEKNSEQFFSSLWKEDLLQRYLSPETGEKIYPGDQSTYWREQQLLFESLKVHTEGKVRWEVLDNWKVARDKCADIVPKLRNEITAVVDKSISQQKMAGTMQQVKKLMAKDMDSKKRIEDIILNHLWQSVYWDKMYPESPRFVTEIEGKNMSIISRDIDVRSRDVTVFTFADPNHKSSVENLTRLFNSTVDALIKGGEVQSLSNEVGNIKKAYKEIGEMLTPVKLKPMIINSRCELCPV